MAFTNRTCIDNETLRIENKFNITEDGVLTEFIKVSNEYCRWGCDNVTHSCVPTKINQNLIILGSLLGIGVVLFILVPKIFGR